MSNVVLNAGVGGATLGTDTVAGVDYQKVKVTFSTDGVAPQSVDATHGLPVAVVAALPTGANVIGAVTQSAGPWTVNLTQLLGTAPDVNSGVKSAGTLRVVIANDQPSLTNALPVSQSGAPWSVSGSGTFTTSDSHLPAAAALSDALANPTTTEIGANLLGWDNTNTVYRRVQVTAGTGKLLVDGSSVTQPVSGTVTTTPPANASSNIAQINGVTPLMGNGVTGTGSLRVTISSDNTPYSVNAVQSGVYTVQPGNTQNTTPWLTSDTTQTSGGSTAGRVISAATTNATSVKASAGRLYTIMAGNTNAAVRYLKFYNKASAPTVGTDTPVLTFPIPANTAGAGFALDSAKGWDFSIGIALALTTGVADADTAAVGANEIVVNLGYK